MPWMQTLLCTLNDRFSDRKISDLVERREIFAPVTRDAEGGLGEHGETWLDRLDGLPGRRPHPAGISYLQAFPAGLREMLRALIYENLCRGDRALPIIWAWAPAYDWEIQAWECPGTRGSPGAFTVLLKSRYPGDDLPSEPSTQD